MTTIATVEKASTAVARALALAASLTPTVADRGEWPSVMRSPPMAPYGMMRLAPKPEIPLPEDPLLRVAATLPWFDEPAAAAAAGSSARMDGHGIDEDDSDSDSDTRSSRPSNGFVATVSRA